MSSVLKAILEKKNLTKTDLVSLLDAGEEDCKLVFEKAASIKNAFVGKKVFYRGLIEFSNFCDKNCLYCGIRAGNKATNRYQVLESEVVEAARYAWKNRFGSLVLQSGERSDEEFICRIENLVNQIKTLSNAELGITLSMGEQSAETYRRWFEAGAHRYLLRIEVSNPQLYRRYHPRNKKHDYKSRLECLHLLRDIGYQVGSGVMIGLPFQTPGDLADDLIFFREHGIDMVGMGPYIEHENTPLYSFKDRLLPRIERFKLSLKMVAILRIMMPDINIAATTAMQAIDPLGREKAIMVGANIIMPNLTPTKYRQDYLLYEDKPCIDEDAEECRRCLEARIHMAGGEVGYGEWGDSKHFEKRKTKTT
ncbi:MAG TPA: [FeFe] hydrogenase H-cluster radical SAM maturase HydE [Bacteroidales bacterium]|nr:[FeFe] hydrogenase H-cluster radical SAM maturase HydE [Bacteroidales bacterium]